MDQAEKSKGSVGPCPGCGHPESPPENRFCGRCGASLERPSVRGGELAPCKEGGLTLRERFLPGGLGPVSRTVAVSLAAVAADAGLTWLRHRLEKANPPAPRDAGYAGPGGGPEYYLLREMALLVREERRTRSWFSSELTIGKGRVEKR